MFARSLFLDQAEIEVEKAEPWLVALGQTPDATNEVLALVGAEPAAVYWCCDAARRFCTGTCAQGDMIKNGDFDKAFDQDADDVRRIAKKKGEDGKYDKAIEEAKAYKDCLKEHGMLPTGGAP